MVRNRRGLAPWSLAREAGIESATVDGTIEVPQYVQPTLDTGFVDEKGDWKGVKSSDRDFGFYHKGVAVGNGEIELCSVTDMTGFNDIQIAIKPSNGGNFAITAVMGPDTNKYANLSPINAASTLKGSFTLNDPTMYNLIADSAESLTADVWNIFYIATQLKNQKVLQFKITNNSGGASDIEVTYLRIV